MKNNDYATKTSLINYMLTGTFNTKSTELENKIKDADIIAKSAVTKANSNKSDLNDYAKKTDVANDITTIKNDYVTNASLTSRLNDLKSQHIANEVKTIDDKTKKNASDILGFENRLKQKEHVVNENERGLSFNRGFFYYLQQSYLVYECKSSSFDGGEFGHTVKQGNFNHTTNAKNVIIFGADMSFSIHATNRANNIYVMGKDFIQGINDTTIYAEKLFHNNFTEHGVKFVLSLHYNGDDSYLFANGRQELKFKAKDDQLITEKLCLGNLSSEWTTSESEKTGLYGNIYDFVVDYKPIHGVGPIYDMHRYLMRKHNISRAS